jgi:hypothetical protein
MKKISFVISFLLLTLFVACKKDDSNSSTSQNPTPVAINPADTAKITPVPLSIFEYSNTQSVIGLVLASKNDVIILAGNKKIDGSLLNIRNISWGAANGSSWLSVVLDADYMPKSMTISDGTYAEFSNFTPTSLDVKITKPNGQVSSSKKTTKVDFKDLGQKLKDSPKTQSACKQIISSKVECGTVAKVALSAEIALAILGGVGCVTGLVETGVLAATGVGLPLAALTFAGTILSCAGTVSSTKDLMGKIYDCKNLVYSKHDNLPNPPTTDILGTSIDNGKEFLENGIKPEAVKGATGNIMKGTFSYFLNELLGQYDRTTYKATAIAQCSSTSAKIEFNFFSQFTNNNVLKPNGTLSLKGTYKKTAFDMQATFVFFSLEGNSFNRKTVIKKRLTKQLPAQQTTGEVNFTLRHTGTNCDEPYTLLYAGSNNYTSTWMYIELIVNGRSFIVGNDKDGTSWTYFWIPPIDIAKNGILTNSSPFCSYDIELQ